MSHQVADCPEPQTLAEFLQGDLSGEQTEFLAQHLAQCDRCGDTVRAAQHDDTLVQMARQADPLTVEDADHVVRLVDRLRDLPARDAEFDRGSRTAAEEILPHLAASAADAELGRLAHFRLLSVLGAGGTSVVFRAEDVQLKRPVAIKVLRPSLGDTARRRFLREARAVAAINHDHVVTIHQVGEVGELAYIAMPWLDGNTLEDRLRCESPLAADEVASWGRQIAQGLAAAHARGVVHRDVKPANIWLEAGSGRALLLDFGLAQTEADDLDLTETGVVAGTPAFMSPEQARGESTDERSDLFSLGSVLYQASTGQAPFRGDNALAILAAIQHVRPPAPHVVNPAVPRPLSRLVQWLLAKRPGDRPRSAVAVAERLEEIGARAGSPGISRWPSLGSRRAVVAAALLLLLAVLVFFAAPIVISVVTGHGELVIKTEDPHVKVEVLRGGEQVHIIDLEKEQAVTIRPGQYELHVSGVAEGLVLSKQKVAVMRGRQTIVEVEQRIKQSATDERIERRDAYESGPGYGTYGSGGYGPPTRIWRADPRLLPVSSLNLEVRQGRGRPQPNSTRADSEDAESPIAFAIVTGLVPIEAQFELYKLALGVSGAPRDFPNYLGYQVERASDASGETWKQIWGADDASRRSAEEVAIRRLLDRSRWVEAVASDVETPFVTMPLPIRMDLDNGRLASHSSIGLGRFQEHSIRKQKRAETHETYGAGYHWTGDGGRFDEQGNPIPPRFLLLRFVDSTVREGRSYRYRVRLRLEDPNNPQDPGERPRPDELTSDVIQRLHNQAREAPGQQRISWRYSPWSESRATMEIPDVHAGQ